MSGGYSPARRGLRGGRDHRESRWDPAERRGDERGTGREPQTSCVLGKQRQEQGYRGGGGTGGLRAVPPTSLCHLPGCLWLHLLRVGPSCQGVQLLPTAPRLPSPPHLLSPPAEGRGVRGGGGGVTLEPGRGGKTFPRSSAWCFPWPARAGSGPHFPSLAPKRHPGALCDTYGGSGFPGGSGISRFARFPLGERKTTGQTLPGAGCPARDPHHRPPTPKRGAYLFSHGTRLSHATRHSLGALKARGWGGGDTTHIGGSPCTQKPSPSPPPHTTGSYSPRHRWVPAAHGVLARRGDPVGGTERGGQAAEGGSGCRGGLSREDPGGLGEVGRGSRGRRRWRGSGGCAEGFPYHGADVSVLALLAWWARHALRGSAGWRGGGQGRGAGSPLGQSRGCLGPGWAVQSPKPHVPCPPPCPLSPPVPSDPSPPLSAPYLQAGGAAEAKVTPRSLISFLPKHPLLPAAPRLPVRSLSRERSGSAPPAPQSPQCVGWEGREGRRKEKVGVSRGNKPGLAGPGGWGKVLGTYSPRGRGARWVPGFLSVPGDPGGQEHPRRVRVGPKWSPTSPLPSPTLRKTLSPGQSQPPHPRHSPPRPCRLCCPSVREAPSRPVAKGRG